MSDGEAADSARHNVPSIAKRAGTRSPLKPGSQSSQL